MASQGDRAALITSSPKGRTPRKRPVPHTRAAESALVACVPREHSVLVVEADPDVQVQIARALRGAGHRVVGTSSGDGALALITEWAVDLILVSQDLPGRAGVEVTRLLRERRPNAHIVLMAMTPEASVCEAAHAAGAEGCVAKPLSLDSLVPWLGTPSNRTVPVMSGGAGVAE